MLIAKRLVVYEIPAFSKLRLHSSFACKLWPVARVG